MIRSKRTQLTYARQINFKLTTMYLEAMGVDYA